MNAGSTTASKWPKTFPPLTAEQERIRDDFMHAWHEELPAKYGVIEKFNHGYVVKHAPASFVHTLEIGAGLGEHLTYERLTAEQLGNYVAVELRAAMATEIHRTHPECQVVVGDCQERLAFDEGRFDRVLAVHVLEHLPNLPAAVREMHRICNKTHGRFQVVIPCEGGLAYSLARRISAQRFFERRYKMSYKWLIEREHINQPHEIFEVLDELFTVEHRSFFPLRIPSVTLNLAIGLTLRPR
jgi:SAM-dependent methyltransferase